MFKDSQKIISQSKNSWVFIFPVVATIFFASVTFAAFEMPAESREEILAQIEAEPPKPEKEEKEEPQQTELPKTKKEDLDMALENKPTTPKMTDEAKSEKVPAVAEEDKTSTPKMTDEKKSVDVNPLLTQTDVGKVFGNYYLAVNDRRYTDAYLYLTDNCKNRLGSIENFAVGHKDTLSIEILDFQQIAASAEAMKATYKICTRDKATNGVKVQIFEGQVTMMKINDKWLIDNLSSQLVETHLE